MIPPDLRKKPRSRVDFLHFGIFSCFSFYAETLYKTIG